MESVFETQGNLQTEIKYVDVLEQFSKLSFYDISDSECISSKCLNKISETNSEKKSYFEKFVSAENKKIGDNQSSSILKNNELLNSSDEGEDGTVFCNHSTKNCEINSKKCSAENPSFVETLENVENELSSLSLTNKRLLNKYNDGNTSAGNESDSDNDEQVESVTLRERHPTRHNRHENNKDFRPAPFLQNHRRASQPHSISNNFQTFPNFTPHIPNDFNTFHNGYAITNTSHNGYAPNPINSTGVERFSVSSSRIFHSDFPSSELVTDEACENMFSSTTVPFDGFIPNTVATNQIVNNINPYAVSDVVFDSSVPSPSDDIGSLSDEFSEEINNFSSFDNLKDQRCFESNGTGCAVIDGGIETSLHSFIEHLTEEEEKDILKILSDLRPDYFSSQNHTHLDLDEESPLHILSGIEVEKELNDSFIFNQNTSSAPTFEEFSCQTNNQHIFRPEPDNRHSKTNVELSLCSHLNEVSNTFEKFEKFYNNSLYLMNESGNYSIPVCMNETLFNTESLSTCTSNHNNVSNEIENGGERERENDKWVNKGQNNAPALSHPETEVSWDMPFVGVDDNSFLECVNTPENRRFYEKKYSKSAQKTKETKIGWKLGTAALDRLLNSPSFCNQVFEDENKKIIEQNLREKEKLGVQGKKVIHILRKHRPTKYRGTNLHRAIQSKHIEKVVSLVECHKKLHDDIYPINIVDSDYKTVLDYSKEYGMDLLTDYLVENLAKEWVKV